VRLFGVRCLFVFCVSCALIPVFFAVMCGTKVCGIACEFAPHVRLELVEKRRSERVARFWKNQTLTEEQKRENTLTVLLALAPGSRTKAPASGKR
jgi:hypothetical protein